jgi:hypothetical protein
VSPECDEGACDDDEPLELASFDVYRSVTPVRANMEMIIDEARPEEIARLMSQ